MADLYHLLDDINDATQTTAAETQSTHASEAWDHDQADGEHEVPHILADKDKLYNDVEEEDKLEEEEDESLQDSYYTQLQSLWTQEVNAPELLAADEETVNVLTQRLEEQEERMEDVLANATDPNIGNLVASIMKVDSDRVRFMLDDLKRTRLEKIEEHPLYMRDMVDHMSDDEVSYLKEYGSLIERHFRRTVLDHLPKDAWKKLDDPEMIDRPNLDRSVFVRLKENVQIESLSDDDDNDFLISEHQAGTCLIVRYSAIRDLLLEGKVELL